MSIFNPAFTSKFLTLLRTSPMLELHQHFSVWTIPARQPLLLHPLLNPLLSMEWAHLHLEDNHRSQEVTNGEQMPQMADIRFELPPKRVGTPVSSSSIFFTHHTDARPGLLFGFRMSTTGQQMVRSMLWNLSTMQHPVFK